MSSVDNSVEDVDNRPWIVDGVAQDPTVAGTRKSNRKNLDASTKALEGFQARLSGRTWGEVAEEVGYTSARTAQQAVLALQRELQDTRGPDVLMLLLGRLDKSLSVAWDAMLDVDLDLDHRLKAMDRVLAITDRHAKLLGLEAPKQIEVTGRAVIVAGGTKAEYLAAIQSANPLELEEGDDSEWPDETLSTQDRDSVVVDAEVVE